MLPFLKRMSGKAGLPPGSLVHVGEQKVDRVRVRILNYDAKRLEEREIEHLADCDAFLAADSVTWIDVRGLHQVEVVRALGERFGLHPLVLEDILNTGQRPKVEILDEYVLIVCKMLSYDEPSGEIRVEQVSLVIGSSFVITFQEQEGDVFDPVRERIRRGRGRIRKAGDDYLVYALLDAVVDHYFVLLESIGESLEGLEEDLMENPQSGVLERIHVLKRELILLRRSIRPMREVLGALQHDDSPLIGEETALFLRDVHDHTVQVIETVETFNDVASGLQDYYMSLMGNRMNEVMKVLTVMATIFIPLTFIAGIYGMNFQHMPELAWSWAYPALLGVMAVLAAGMIAWFKWKRFF